MNKNYYKLQNEGGEGYAPMEAHARSKMQIEMEIEDLARKIEEYADSGNIMLELAAAPGGKLSLQIAALRADLAAVLA